MKVNLLVLYTSKLEDLKQFYSNLGVKFQKETHGNGPEHYAAILNNGLVLELYPTLDTPCQDFRLGMSVDNIKKILSLLGEALVPKKSPWGLHAIVRDPDGRVVELLQEQTSIEDCYLAESVLERIRAGKEAVHSSSSVRKELGLDDMKPFVVKSDDNTKFMILDQGFAASCIDGVWTEKALFNGYQLDQDFSQVDDSDEAAKIIENAKTFLGK